MVDIYASEFYWDNAEETSTTTTSFTRSQLRLQLASPEAYDGTGVFDDWLRRVLAYFNLNNQRDSIIAQHYVEYAPEAHSREQMTQIYDVDLNKDTPAMGADYLASVLFNVVLHTTKSRAYTVTRTALHDSELETLRLLREQFGRTRRTTMISTLINIVLQKFGDNQFMEQLTKWELDISEYDLLKATLLATKTSGAVYRYLCMQIGGLTTYQKAKTMIVNFAAHPR